jgi:hypothetical protein
MKIWMSLLVASLAINTMGCITGNPNHAQRGGENQVNNTPQPEPKPEPQPEPAPTPPATPAAVSTTTKVDVPNEDLVSVQTMLEQRATARRVERERLQREAEALAERQRLAAEKRAKAEEKRPELLARLHSAREEVVYWMTTDSSGQEESLKTARARLRDAEQSVRDINTELGLDPNSGIVPSGS